jgi:hypothetical protein
MTTSNFRCLAVIVLACGYLLGACGSSGGSGGNQDLSSTDDPAGTGDAAGSDAPAQDVPVPEDGVGGDVPAVPDVAGGDVPGVPDVAGGDVPGVPDVAGGDVPGVPDVAGGDTALVAGGWDYTEKGWFALTPEAGKKAVYRVSDCGSPPGWTEFEATADANADYDGQPCMKIALNEVDGGASIVAYADVGTPWVIKAYAIEVWGEGDTTLPGMAYVFDPPYELSMDPTIPQQVSTGTGKMTFGATSGDALEISVDSTLESTDATVEVPFGTVTGVTHFAVTLKECPVEGNCPFDGFPADGWFHPDHLVVKLAVVPGYCEVELVESWK